MTTPRPAAPVLPPEEQEAQKKEAEKRETEIKRTEAMRREVIREMNRARLDDELAKEYDWTRLGHQDKDSFKQNNPESADDAGMIGTEPRMGADKTLETGVYRDTANSKYGFFYDKEKNTIKTLGGGTPKSYEEAGRFFRDKAGYTGFIVNWAREQDVHLDTLKNILIMAEKLKLKVTFGDSVLQALINHRSHLLEARAEPDASGEFLTKSAISIFDKFEALRLRTVEASDNHFREVNEALKVHDAVAALETSLGEPESLLAPEDAVRVMTVGGARSAAADKIKTDFGKMFKTADGTASLPDAERKPKIESELKKLEDRLKKLQGLQDKVANRLEELDRKIGLKSDKIAEHDRTIAEKNARLEEPGVSRAEKKKIKAEISVLQKDNVELHKDIQMFEKEKIKLNDGAESRKGMMTEESARIKLQQEVVRTEATSLHQLDQQPLTAEASAIDARLKALDHDNQHFAHDVNRDVPVPPPPPAPAGQAPAAAGPR